MAKILLMITLAAASLAAKDRAWQTGKVLDNDLNPYFRTASSDGKAKPGDSALSNAPFAVGVNVNHSSGEVAYDDFVIEGGDTVYMVEFTRLKTYKAAHVSLSLPVTFAVEKNKLFIMDLDKMEYETTILKQSAKPGSKQGDAVAAVEVKPAPVKPAPPAPKPAVRQEAVQAKAEPAVAKPAPAPTVAKAEPVKPEPVKPAPVTKPAKPDTFALASVQKPSPVTAPKPELKPPPAPKPEPKVEAVASKPARPEPGGKTEGGTSVRASSKDRAWQGGQLLSIINNNYFFNVTYSSDTEGGGWPFVQGSDGRYTVNGQIGNPTDSLYTYDNYVIESQFVVYLVQRMRPKTSPMVRLPGTRPLKFAVEKSKLWVLDEENKEYETKVIRLIQKDAIVDPLARAATR